VVALQVAPSHALAHVLRIERIAERLEVEAPEEAGWIRKETKIRAQRFDRFYLSDLKIEPSETTMKLRAAPDGSGAGFDLLFTHEPRRVRLIRVFEAGDTPESPYDALGEDVVKLQALHDDVVAMARSLGEHKKSLVSASLDGTPLQQLEAPRELVERIVENIAPTVQEIAKRSLTRGELVLKRLLGDNHREELFVSKAELAQKVEALPVALQRAFEPLGLWESARSGAESPAPVRETISSKPEASAAVVASRSHIQTLPMTPVPAASPTPPGPDGPTASSPPLKPIAQSSQAAMAAQLPSSRPPRP
jgi:hypothetical protein